MKAKAKEIRWWVETILMAVSIIGFIFVFFNASIFEAFGNWMCNLILN